MERIVVVGTPGAGKTTLAQELAAAYQMPFVDLDALFWGPEWQPAAYDLFRERVKHALTMPRWAVGGNYNRARDLIWQQADTLIWLDYPFWFIFQRLLRRTLRRIITSEELWAGNRETWREAFLSHDSLLLFAIRTHWQRRRDFSLELAQQQYAHLRVVRVRAPVGLKRWKEAETKETHENQ
jgi:adenylate kinase family enzyme